MANERNGAHTSDECYKMAYTDAISVCCKQLGFGADVYWQKDRTKYDQQPDQQSVPPARATPVLVGKDHMIVLANELTRTGWDVGSMLDFVGKKFNCKLTKIEEMTIQQFTWIMSALQKKPDKAAQNG